MKANKNQYHLISTDEMEQEAIQFLQENEPEEGYGVGFSGGKDSCVLLEVVKRSGVKFKAYYSQTGLDPPELVKFIRKNHPEVEFRKPEVNFWKLIEIKNPPPTRWMRWCCDALKKQPVKDIKHMVNGIRAEESYNRAKRERIDIRSKNRIEYKPLFHWTEFHVWDYIESNDLPYCNLYDQGFDRLGCIICPFHMNPNGQVFEMMKFYPKYFKRFEIAVSRWWKNEREGKDDTFKTFNEFMKAYYRGFK